MLIVLKVKAKSAFQREQDKEVGCLPQVCPFMTNTQATQTQPYPPSGGTSVSFGCGCSVCSESCSGIFFSKSIDALQSPSSRGLRSMPSSASGVRVFIPNFYKRAQQGKAYMRVKRRDVWEKVLLNRWNEKCALPYTGAPEMMESWMEITSRRYDEHFFTIWHTLMLPRRKFEIQCTTRE